MTDRPSDDGRTARSDAASRLAALLADVVDAPAPAPPDVPAEGAARPDTEPAEAVDVEVEIDEPAEAEPVEPEEAEPVEPEEAEPVGPAEPDPPTEAEAGAKAAVEAPVSAGDDGPPEGPGDGGPIRRVTLRAVAFGTALALLIAAVPALGWVGKERLLRSRGGDVVDGTAAPDEPGYRALVKPTPTTLVVLRDDDGRPVSTTVLALGAGDAGGTVLQVPMGTQLHQPVYAPDLRTAWDLTEDDELLRRLVESVLGVALPPPAIDLTDDDVASLVGPVAPLEIAGTDPIVTDDGTAYSGDISLSAEEVGPYLRARSGPEGELADLARTERVWSAWLGALHEVGPDEGVGAATTGIGPFLRTLAAGEPVVETLDVERGEGDGEELPPLVPASGFDQQVADAVPFPQTPSPGRRPTIKLLNGAEGATLPMDLMHDLVVAGGALVTLGNAGELGQERSSIEYGDPDWRATADDMAAVLGGDVEVEQVPTTEFEAESVDLVITIGWGVLEGYEDG